MMKSLPAVGFEILPGGKKLSRAELPELSVVVIARNEEQHIAKCLRSILFALQDHTCEVILVDSASTDQTVEIARQFPIRIVQLPKDFPLRPAAGRHVGFGLTQGKWILFMDGDSELDPNWIEPALKALENPRLGGVAGVREEVFVPADTKRVEVRNRYENEVDHANLGLLGGPALYKRAVLEQVGGFNPFLYANEEAELGGRIRAAGYSVRRLGMRMTRHFVENKKETLTELRRRFRRGFPYGKGQLMRYGMKHRCLRRDHFADVDRHLGFLGFLLAGVISLAQWIVWGKSFLMQGWLIVGLSGFLFLCWRARGIRRPIYYLIEWTLSGPMIVRGFLMRPRAADEYPAIHPTER